MSSDHHTFESLGLSHWLVKSLKQLFITTPSEIQWKCIPHTLKGRNVIGVAKTGSGKTAAFALPILQSLSEDPYGVFAIILTPTRELAFQIAEQVRVLGSGINLKLSVVVGGMDMMKQAIELSQRPHIIIATPGRLADHIKSSANAIHFNRLKFLVLDEVDRLLDESFADDLEVILSTIPKKRQTLLYTATLTDEIRSFPFPPESTPFIHECKSDTKTVETLDQRYILVPSAVRDVYMTYLLRKEFPDRTMILFTSKCRTCERLRVMLKELGIRSTALHSQMPQQERIASLAKFKGGVVKVLVTTDVGSRGLDIPSVQVVLNYELPADASDYIHRVGRTARAGRGGVSLSIVTERDIDILENTEDKIQKKMEELTVPENAVLESLNEVSLAKRIANMHLLDTNFGNKKRINEHKKRVLDQAERKASSRGGNSGKRRKQT